MNGWFNDRDEKRSLGIESLNIFTELLSHYKFSAHNLQDMETVRRLLIQKKCSKEIIEGVIWRYQNLSGLC